MTATAAPQFYFWKIYRCAYEYYAAPNPGAEHPPLLLIHPLGVGLAGWFWHRFCHRLTAQSGAYAIYNPDLLGCGYSDKPKLAYTPNEWAAQLADFIRCVVRTPVIAIVQGGSLSIGLKLMAQPGMQDWISALVLSGPPGWQLMTTPTSPGRQKLLWTLLFSGPLGAGFFRYARREAFLQSFSRRQLFAHESDIDREWLDQLQQDASDAAGRYAVYSFLAGFWREDYTHAIKSLQIPTLVIFGDAASGINRLSRRDDAQKRLEDYLQHLPQATGQIIPGRNVLPYESTEVFLNATISWLQAMNL